MSGRVVGRVGVGSLGLWVAFVAVHVALSVLGVVVVPVEAFWDVDLYRWWAATALDAGRWPVLDEPWVYPVGALLPMLLPALGDTTTTAGYAVGWCLLVTVLDAVATAVLLRTGSATSVGRYADRAGSRGAWWWLAFLVLLGPVAIGRLDAVITPLMVVALALVARDARRSAAAAALLTVGAWIKVAPGALLLPLAAVARRPWHEVVAMAAGVTAVVLAAVTLGGGLPRVASFLTTQRGRGLQVESVAATPWVLAGLVRDDVEIRLNQELITYEVTGPGTGAVAHLLDVVLVLGVLLVGGALLVARRHGLAAQALLPSALTLVGVLVVANKVGSPQLVTWFAAPVSVLLTVGALSPRLRSAVAGLALVTAALTQVVFPWGYVDLLGSDAAVTAVLAARNVALVLLLACAVVALRRSLAEPQRRGATSRATRSRWSRSARSSTWR